MIVRESIYKKLPAVIAVLISLFVVFLSIYLWNYLRYGTITVTSGDKNNIIKISEIGERGVASENLFEKTATGELSVRVSPGKYIVHVESKVFSLNKTVNVEARKNKEYNLNPPGISDVEPVASVAANNLYSGKDYLRFVDPGAGFLHQITKSNKMSLLAIHGGFQRVEWSEIGTGVAQDKKGNLYTIRDKNSSKIALPEGSNAPSSTGFDVSPNGTLYISNKNGVFVSEDMKEPRKIRQEASTMTPVLAASNELLAIVVPPPHELPPDHGPTENPSVEVVDKSGDTVAKKDINATNGSWSPDGNKLILVDFLGSSGIYNKKLELLSTLPSDQTRQAIWLDDERVIYTSENIVWLYSMPDEQSQTVASLPLGNTIVSVTANKSNKYIYLSAHNTEGSNIYRLSLTNKDIPEHISKLGVFLPVRLDACHLSYVNFSGKPLIIMRTIAQNKTICKAQTDIELIQDGLNRADFDFRFEIAPEDL